MTFHRLLLTTTGLIVICLILTGASHARAQDTTGVGSISGWNRSLNMVEVNKQLGIFHVIGLEWRF